MCAATAPPPPAAAATAASSGPGVHGFFPVPASSASCPARLSMAGSQDVSSGPDCRSRYQLLLSGKALADRYRQIYTAAVNDREQQSGQAARNKKILSKKKTKKEAKDQVKREIKKQGRQPGKCSFHTGPQTLQQPFSIQCIFQCSSLCSGVAEKGNIPYIILQEFSTEWGV